VSDEHDEAINHLYSILGAIPDPDHGHINMVPFAVESDGTNALKRKIATGIVKSLADQGYSMALKQAAPSPDRRIRVVCRSCGNPLIAGVTDHTGAVSVAAPALLSSLSKMSLECPHKALTPEDHRRYLQEVAAATEAA
jgi:hypothetical protein